MPDLPALSPSPSSGALRESASSAELRTPEEWAKALGYVGKPSSLTINGQKRPTPFKWQHAVADQIHGWSRHKLHSAAPLKLSRLDYEAALEVISSSKGRSYRRHAAAVSPFRNRK